MNNSKTFQIDLLKQTLHFKKFQLILGSFFLVSAFFLFFNTPDGARKMYLLVNVPLYFLLGISLIFNGFGYPITWIYGKAYVKIDSQKILIKQKIFEKEQSANWNDISEMSYQSGKFLINYNNGSPLILSVSKLEYYLLKEVKEKVAEFATLKGIEIKNL